MNTRRDNADGPEDIDAAFAEIVADLERDSTFARWPEDTSANAADTANAVNDTAVAEPQPELDLGPRDWGPRDWVPKPDEAEEHFVPPEPPPLPTPRPATLLGIAVIAMGLLILLVPGLAGMSGSLTMPLGLVLISAGIGWLLLRLRQGPPNSEDDDGAQV
ncbi:DUF308 domain-containing protein [Saccharopolyspora phatthalungensis]|uniref:DUF308 domain-containing protein n=1 Tax=Saccharopolyspora phatthalungensis TaxID=664693 RepID=A0A840Q6Z0_9PSEU|nr:DUF308 domain-containing protein [Saccharopolyspora phatthalungensis]MBB5156226.1 hypothetical protein [Saccharopolyspora phatthalungensis]